MESGMSDGWSSGLVVPLTLAGPCYADVALPGVGLFLCGSASISLLSSISIDNSSSYRGQGDLGVFMFFCFFFFFSIFYSLLIGFFLVVSLVYI